MHVLCLELVRDGDVQITVVLLAWSCVELTFDGLAFFDCEDILQVEDCLFPVGVFGVRAGGEADRLVALGEFNIEPCNDSVDEIVAADLEGVRHLESKVGDGAGVEIEGDDWGGVSHDSLNVDGVDKRLGHGSRLERSVVKTPDIVPDC